MRPHQYLGAFLVCHCCLAHGGETSGWQDLARMREGAAVAQFERHSDRESQLGLAISLLNVQPKTESNLARAEALLREVERGNADDLAGITALYYRARLEQIHRLEPNGEKAARLFEELIARHAEHPFAQVAVVKLALLRLYSQARPDRRRVLQEVALSGANLTFPPAIRDFHLVLADACARWEVSDAESLAHLLAAYRSGALSGKMVGDVCVRIAELSRLQGQNAQAAEFYQKFLAAFPRDLRSFTVRRRLEGLP